jgi:hypothetical protein
VFVSYSAPQERVVLPGGLVMLSAFWMIGSWLVAIGPASPVQPSAATYEPGVRLMLVCVGIGLFIAWPLLRLSQQPTSFPARQTMLDLTVLLVLTQLVVWLPRVLTVWSISRTAALAVFLASWTLLVGAVVAAAVGAPRSGPRNWAMGVCLAICLLGPLVVWLGGHGSKDAASLVRAGPLLGISALTDGGSTRPSPGQWNGVLIVAAAAVAAWVVVAGRSLLRRRGSG